MAEPESNRTNGRRREPRSILPFVRGTLAGAGGALIGVGIAIDDLRYSLVGAIAVAIPMSAITIRNAIARRRQREALDTMMEEMGPAIALSSVARAIVGPGGLILQHNLPWHRARLPEETVPEAWLDFPADGTPQQFILDRGGRQVEVAGRPVRPFTNYYLLSVRELAGPTRIDPGIFEHADLGWFEMDRDGVVTGVNGTLADWLGRSVEEVGSGKMSVFGLFKPADNQDAGDDRFHADLLPLDGPPFPVEVVLQTDVLGGGTRGGLVIDLREIVRSVQALAESAERFGRFIDDAPVGIAALTAEGSVEEANPVFAELALGVADTELILSRNLRDLIEWPEGEAKTAADFAQVLAGVEGTSAELRFKATPAITTRMFATRARRAGSGERPTRIVYMIDVSAQKALEAQFVQSQKMQAVGQLAGGIAHDFNNLLTAIIGFCDLLLTRHGPEDDSFPDIMQVKQNANRAANLVRQLLAFSRRQTLRPKIIDIRDTLNDLSTLLRRLIGANIKLDLDHAQDLGLVRVDPSQFDQVIINLVVNARDAMAEGGRIQIRTRNAGKREARRIAAMQLPPGDYVMIEVTDDGHGIPRDVLPQIFEPFFTTKEIGAGTGLGLSTVYGIVKQTGGSIVAESEPGQGTTFRILLPRHVEGAAEAVPEPAERAEPATSGSETILIVEDEDAVRNFAVRALRRQGYRVLEAATGEEALDLIEAGTERIDLMVSDVVMPSMDGPTLARMAMERLPALKVIMISGYAEEQFRKSLDPGLAFTFLAKPFSLKQLGQLVREVLDGR
ncbi:PAS domain-containing sensor histidine kinase [Oleomonas cavernae]|uniref:histidine kinase n=1 Tax=Oleomonas cavernae TaxID=2320859 RepID=A0A418WAT1_9PROT|nr:PAS domain-containing sensor histidine kinase [Oleomonas cavernae]RJF87132.1 PAS domain-containing sensor histidine kinase [Oleomonas cavernae]